MVSQGKLQPPTRALLRLATVISIAVAATCVSAQVKEQIFTAKGTTSRRPSPHPLSWWTQKPLRLDESGDLMLGIKASDGKPVTAKDYRVNQETVVLGTIAGRRIVQILTNIEPGTRIITSGWASVGGPPMQWKRLLVQAGSGDRYIAIYSLQAESGEFQALKRAAIYGNGAEAILGTFDPDSGMGGGCTDGYWWFDSRGAHLVNFSPLLVAIGKALPPKSTYTNNCRALDPKKEELRSWVQRSDSECQACGGLGTVDAEYKIVKGAAIPIAVHFDPESR